MRLGGKNKNAKISQVIDFKENFSLAILFGTRHCEYIEPAPQRQGTVSQPTRGAIYNMESQDGIQNRIETDARQWR
jgi:hypothetical protein